MRVLSRPLARSQCHLFGPRRLLVRRFAVGPAAASPLNRGVTGADAAAPPDVKSYDAIVREMEARSTQWDEKSRRIDTNFLNRPCAVDELYKPLDLGDIVLLNLDPVIIIGTPDVPDGPYIVADAVGRAKEVFRNMIDARLMSFVQPAHLDALRGHLYMRESAATDPGLEIGVEPSVTSSAPTSRVVSQAVHRLVARPLRQLYNDAMRRAQRLLPKVVAALERRQQAAASPIEAPRASTLSFVDLVLEVCPSETSQYCAADFYAVRMCLDHYTLVHKYLLDFSYTGKYALTVLPAAAERRNLEVVYGSKMSKGFVTDYARENVPSAEGESRAIELLRRQFPGAGRIDPAAAAELLQLPAGDLSERARYSWFRKRRDSVQPLYTPDQNGSLRQAFDEPVYCIDSAEALEIDDGISLQRLPTSENSVRLGIHIANPSAFTQTRPMAEQMLHLPTTVYELNGAAIPMLPRSLTHDQGLVAGSPRPALTLFVDVDLTTMRFSNIRLAPLVLSQILNITPEAVNEARDKFADFAVVANALRTNRLAKGAFDLQLAAAPGFATQIVSEFMVLANHLVAVYGMKHGIPLLYRSQRVLAQSRELRDEYNKARAQNQGRLGLRWRPIVQKSLVSVTPERHTGIGYDATTRFTSPLRRLEDYITHSQIEAHLRGEQFPFSEKDLARMVPWLQVSQELVREYQRQLVLYERLKELKPGDLVEGVVSQVPWVTTAASVQPKTRVYLPQYEAEADYVGSAQLGIEEACRVVIDSVSSHAGRVEVLLAGETRS